MSKENQKELVVDSSPMVVTLSGAIAKTIRKLAILEEIEADLLVHSMVGIGVGMYTHSLKRPDLFEEFKAQALPPRSQSACTHPRGSAMCSICTLDPNDKTSQQAIAADELKTRR